VINGYLEGRKGLEQDFKWNSLTTRERAVLKLVAEGLRNKEIADLLCISLNTVEKHRDNLMKKLDLHNASSLTLYAQEKGLLSE
jgi:DNA-binding NarL/FixJ family response regulator